MKPFTAALTLLSLANAGAQSVSNVTLSLNGRELGPTTAYLSAGRLMLPLTAFATVGWKPLLDTENGIVDLAGCLRIGLNRPKMWLIGGVPTLGVQSASVLALSPVNAQFRAGHWYLPVQAVANQMLYTVNFDKANLRVNIRKPTDPAKINPNVEACLQNVAGNN